LEITLTIYLELNVQNLISIFFRIAIFIVRWTKCKMHLLLSARLSHRNYVRLSVCQTGGSVKNGAS